MFLSCRKIIWLFGKDRSCHSQSQILSSTWLAVILTHAVLNQVQTWDHRQIFPSSTDPSQTDFCNVGHNLRYFVACVTRWHVECITYGPFFS